MYHSHPALTYVQRLLHKKQFVIPCGIHIPRQLQISDVHIRTPYILFVGRIEKGKGCEVLLRAFHEVRALNPNVRLIFIGEDTNLLFGARTYTSYIQYLRTNVLTKDMEKFVTFLNRKTQANLSKYYQQCLYAVIPSFGNENMPFTALDAMKYGKPLIVSNTGGLPEFVKHARNGLVVSPEDEKALAAAMIQLIHDADMRQRFSINNFRDRNKFESKKIASATIKFYQSI
jgi:glycosyltransferase involved in cell wall biosynthesis